MKYPKENCAVPENSANRIAMIQNKAHKPSNSQTIKPSNSNAPMLSTSSFFKILNFLTPFQAHASKYEKKKSSVVCLNPND